MNNNQQLRLQIALRDAHRAVAQRNQASVSAEAVLALHSLRFELETALRVLERQRQQEQFAPRAA